VNSIVKSLIAPIRCWQRNLLDTLVRKYYHQALEARAEGMVRLFERDIPERCRILDLGGGWGFYNEPFKRRGHESLILDVVKPGYQKAPVVIYDGGRIPFGDRAFDVTLMATMLHHVPDPESMMAEVRRVTRTKVVVIEDLYHHAIGRLWTIARDRILNMEFLGHPHQFRKHEEWIQFFRKKDFRLEKFRKFYTWISGFRILNGLYVWECGEHVGAIG
jgi:ubiquinone/menaquinone biosynthesis C-methylase UbiE